MRTGQSPIPPAGWLTITPLDGRAVAGLFADAREAHLQAVSLEFVDVAAARFLITPTGRPGHPAVIAQHPPPSPILLSGEAISRRRAWTSGGQA